MPDHTIVVPSARRLTESLRDIGYELPTAVADLVDNSLDADATEVNITVAFAGADSWIRIADNGSGMSGDRLDEAMRYGTDREYGAGELGKFGLGLKTASLSQCRRLSVATRAGNDSIRIRCWDLDRIAEADSWELMTFEEDEVEPRFTEPIRNGTGTVVTWDRLDRILNYRLPDGLAAEHGLAALCRDIEEHLAMVFHRFLSGTARRDVPFRIAINNQPVPAWDPFARDESMSQALDRSVLTLRHAGRDHRITVQPYILPNQMQFSTSRAWEGASGPRKWNRQQGFYIYRGNRMIQSGGWNRLRTFDEHTKLARIAVDIPPAADSAFEINVSKMRVTIPAELRGELKGIAATVASRAQSAYRQRAEGSRAAGGRPPGPAPPDVGSVAGGGLAGHAVAEERASLDAGSRNGQVSLNVVRSVLERELGDLPHRLVRILAAIRAAAGGRDGSASG